MRRSSHRTRQSTPSASLSASAMTSALRCSHSRLASGADSWRQHQRVALDRAHGRAGQHHLGGAAALPHLVAHGRPHGSHGRGAGFARGSCRRRAARSAGQRLGCRFGLGRFGLGLGSAAGSARAPASARLARWPRRRRAAAAAACRNGHVQPGLDALDPLQQRRFGVAGRRQQQPRAHHLEQQPRRGRAAHLTEPGVHHLGVAGQRRRARAGPPDRASAPARPPARRPRRGRPRREPPAAR